MIREIDFERLSLLCEPRLSKKKPDVLLVRLCSNAMCFSKNGLCTIYEIEKSGEIIGVICRYGGAMTLCLFKKPDFDELCSFLSVAPITSLECGAKTGRKISKKLKLCRLSGRAMLMKKPKSYADYKVYQTQNVSDFFDVLKSADPFYKETSYEEYYCDVFYRSSLPAELFLAEYCGKKAATVAIMHRFNDIAIISDVSVLPDLRRRGLGGSIVAEVCKNISSKGQLATLLCTSKNALSLYKKIGFKSCGRFCLISFNTKDDTK